MVTDTGKAEAMQDGTDGRGEIRRPAANDNPGPEARVEDAVMRLARLLGRQNACEHFQQSETANDNAPTGEASDR